MENLIISTRKQLMNSSFSQYGPQAIYYAIEQQGYTPPPIWSISRVLKRNNLVRNNKISGYIPKGKAYPYDYILCHQMDLVGPRYLACKSRYYFLSLIDCDTHWAQTGVLQTKCSDSVCKELIRFWKIVGIPDFLQMDNDLSFWGSLRRPEAVGKIIRLCLSLNVTPVFIPLSEPWRNGVVEHVNKTMQQYLLKIQHENVQALRETAAHFDQIHNHSHHYSSQSGMTPIQAYHAYEYPLAKLNQNYEMPKTKIPLEEGEIHVIRFIRRDQIFHIFGLHFLVPETAKYEYIRGVILVNENRLVLYKDYELIAQVPFILY